VEGPGDVTVYLQTGNFGQTTLLWSSLEPFPQQSWIEVNTHTHANWVFSEPGIYLIEIEFDGDLVSGESVSARDTLRFAVGDQTDAEAAFRMAFDSGPVAGESPGGAEEPPGDADPGDGGLSTLIWISVGAVGAVLVAVLVVAVVTTRKAKARARAARSGQGAAE
ncbi:MAG: choice-of-anchor M domain-containing protein, partial [Propionibacteriaceae bacterium]|nr:choice-of-anchor M domain-containing protein [Propionibacteriaceae bacterium]